MASDALTNRLDILMSGRSAAGESAQEPELVYTHDMSFGTGEGKCSEEYWEVNGLTVPASSFINLALATGLIESAAAATIGYLKNAKGETLAWTKIRRLIIQIVSPTGIPVIVGNGASLRFSGPMSSAGTYTIPGYVGALMAWENTTTAAWPVSASLTNLKIANSELTNVVVKVYIGGEATAT